MLHFSHTFHRTVLLLMLPSMTGCLHWSTVNQPVPEAVEAHPGTPLRITLLEGAPFKVDSGLVRLDSLVTWRTPDPLFATDHATGERVRLESRIEIIPLAEVRRVQVGSPGPDGLVMGVVAAAAAGALLMAVALAQLPECTPTSIGPCR